MSGPNTPDPSAPVPEEFAATYAEAYRRALESGEYDELNTGIHPIVVVDDEAPTTHRAVPVEPAPWLRPVGFAVLAVVLVLAAYLLGKAISGGSDDPSPTGAATTGTATMPTDRPTDRPTRSGATVQVLVDRARASCRAPAAVDSAGRPVQYGAPNTLDHDPSTAWRCDGSAVGETLRFTFAGTVDLVQVGLIPGYAKTDPVSGADRYAENNRITQVRWTLADGVSVVQNLNPDSRDRSVQTLRVPRTRTGQVTLEILAVAPGGLRDTTAISTVAFEAAS